MSSSVSAPRKRTRELEFPFPISVRFELFGLGKRSSSRKRTNPTSDRPGQSSRHFVAPQNEALTNVRVFTYPCAGLLSNWERGEEKDLQFYHFLHYVTDLTNSQIMLVFDLLDWDGKGEVSFDEFYMLVCIIMAHENQLEKQFMYRHSHPVFELLDIDGGHTVGPAEFKATRFLFNIKKTELSLIFKDFDISGDEQLNYKEFKMFTIFCIDRQQRKAKEKLRHQMAKAEAEEGSETSFSQL